MTRWREMECDERKCHEQHDNQQEKVERERERVCVCARMRETVR
jgi:hypothetical protein